MIMQDVRTQMGTLLVPRGYEVTSAFLERVANFGPELLGERVKVTVPAARGVDPGGAASRRSKVIARRVIRAHYRGILGGGPSRRMRPVP